MKKVQMFVLMAMLVGCQSLPIPGGGNVKEFMDEVAEDCVASVKKPDKSARTWTSKQASEANNAVAIFKSYSKNTTSVAEKERNEINYTKITIPPQSLVKLQVDTYCMDSGNPAPKRLEKMHLVKTDKFFNRSFLSTYANLMEYSHQNPKEHGRVQRIVWNIRNSYERGNSTFKLSQKDQELINSLSPPEFNYEDVTNKMRGKAKEEILKAIEASGVIKQVKGKITDMTASLNSGEMGFLSKFVVSQAIDEKYIVDKMVGFLSNPFSSEMMDELAESNINMDQLALENADLTQFGEFLNKWKPKGIKSIPDDNSDYSMLSKDIAAKIVHNGGYSKTHIELINSSNQPFEFVPSRYACESTRKVQRLAIAGVESGNLILNDNFLSELLMGDFSTENGEVVSNDRIKDIAIGAGSQIAKEVGLDILNEKVRKELLHNYIMGDLTSSGHKNLAFKLKVHKALGLAGSAVGVVDKAVTVKNMAKLGENYISTITDKDGNYTGDFLSSPDVAYYWGYVGGYSELGGRYAKWVDKNINPELGHFAKWMDRHFIPKWNSLKEWGTK